VEVTQVTCPCCTIGKGAGGVGADGTIARVDVVDVFLNVVRFDTKVGM
jgi:hypothetical protein